MKNGEKHGGGGGHGGGGHKKAKKHEEGLKVDAPLWMMSWADMVTLLMALFVAMYSISNIDVVRFREFIKGIRGEFANEESSMTAEEAMEKGLKHLVPPSPEAAPQGEGRERGDADTRTPAPGIYKRSNKWRERGQQAQPVLVTFEEGSATLTAPARESLRRQSEMLRGYESRIEIRGHCSAGEVDNPRNLSYMRAMAVYEFLSDPAHGHIADDRLKITAMGLADPLSPDQTDYEKAQNRVVEVTESPEYPQKTAGR